MSEHDLHNQLADSSFSPLAEQQDFLFAVLELFPFPTEVFSSEGVSLFVNSVFLEFFNLPDPLEIVGKLNILQDPYINNQLGFSDYLRRVFSGEILSYYNIRIPFEEISYRYQSQPSKFTEEDMYQDITSFPLWNEDGALAYVVTLFMTKRVYQSGLDVIKAREYIDTHWLDDFDLDEIARHVGLSRHHLARLFKRFIGMTPYSYYQEIKVGKIKEALSDTSLSIREAFASCGADYGGCFAKAFKIKTGGLTPSQYRKTLPNEPGDKPRNMGVGEKAAGVPGPLRLTSQYSEYETEKRLFQTAELFPIPIQIFKPNGDIAFVNDAVLRMWNVLDTSQIMEKYNLINDPFVNEQFGLRDYIQRTFRGEVVMIPDIRIPLENFWEWYKTRSAVYDIEAVYSDILNFPILNADGEMAYVMSIFFTRRIYQGRADIAKSREYLENHWREEFNLANLAEAAGLSPSHLVRQFKKHTGMTPYSYYQEIKITHLKEALRNKNLNIAQAFISCGFRYPGNFARFFKKRVGMTPSQYRKTMNK